jgi:NADH:ubiquinone oxidoreductase subunit H
MWAFFSRRLRMWVILAVGVPVAAWLLRRVGAAIEARRGPNGVSRNLQKVGGWLQRRATGPLSRRGADPTSGRDPGAPAR